MTIFINLLLAMKWVWDNSKKRGLLVLALCFFTSMTYAQTWSYNWSTRTDRDGQPAGIYSTTPYPITETASTYSFKSDEFPAGKTYNLGERYFVDGARPDNSGDGRSLATAKKTIGAALMAAGSGNNTIIIRGAHDTFSGIYPEKISFGSLAGVDDTHRLMLVGYGQERPVIDGTNSTESIINRSYASSAYITLQRLKLQNTKASGVRLGWNVASDKRDSFFNCIDIWFYGCGNDDAYVTDGNCYYLNVDYGFISHCTAERSVGHGIKIGDGSSFCTVEWVVARENGWWAGKTNFGGSRPCALDFPADAGRTGMQNVARYNIAYSCLLHGMQLRRQANFYAHHNEIYDFGHGVDMQGNLGGVFPYGALVLAESWGNFHQNVVHDGYAMNSNGAPVFIQTSQSNFPVSICNNLFYGAPRNAEIMQLGYQNMAPTYVYGNTFIQSNSLYTVNIRALQTTNELINNIFVQLGSGSCGVTLYTTQNPRHEFNLYYHPRGTAAEWGETGIGEKGGDPQFKAWPSGPFMAGFGDIYSTSPAVGAGTNLSVYGITKDFSGTPRAALWDIGAYASTTNTTGPVSTKPAPPKNLIIRKN